MSEHQVAFHIGTGHVVCSCGAYFESPTYTGTLSVPTSAVAMWAVHLAQQTGKTLQDAYDDGWDDACSDWRQQGDDPGWPIGRRKKGRYPGGSPLLDMSSTGDDA